MRKFWRLTKSAIAILVVSDVDGPYAGMPPEAPPRVKRHRALRLRLLMPATEVYTVLRENGFFAARNRSSAASLYTIP